MKLLKKVTIGSQYGVVIANGDDSGLADNEADQLYAWADHVRGGNENGAFFILDSDDMISDQGSDSWGKCDVTGLDGNVITVGIYDMTEWGRG